MINKKKKKKKKKKKMVGMVIVGNAIHEGVYPPSKAPDQGLYY